MELPIDVTAATVREVAAAIPLGFPRGLSPTTKKAMNQVRREQLLRSIDQVANLINIAQKPVLYVGQGIFASSEGTPLLRALADKASIPVTTSLQGPGAFDETDTKALHLLDLHGSSYANMAIQQADLIIALGARFDDRVTGSHPKFAPEDRLAAIQGRGGIVHFDISPKNVNKVVEATVPVVGDCAENLKLILPGVQQKRWPEWLAQIQV